MDSQPHCGNCYYFYIKDAESDDGVCRRRSPIVTGGMMSPPESIWPSVDRYDWCGEHSTAERATPDHPAG